MKCSEMRNLIKVKFFFYIIHEIDKFYKITIVCAYILLQQNQNKKLMLSINMFGIFAGVKVQSGRLNRLKTEINKFNILI
ncbi:hypothetical protein SDC9_114628 [bioreactor metagenome]|uniref:Uncharacterized protein n=1 Tax=bioreactor metagenome TaxID=1076179 RepID=A0A645C165_9ZZZZ